MEAVDQRNPRLSLDAMVAMTRSDLLCSDIKGQVQQSQLLCRRSEALRVLAQQATIAAHHLAGQLTHNVALPLVATEDPARPTSVNEPAPPALMRLDGPSTYATSSSRVAPLETRSAR